MDKRIYSKERIRKNNLRKGINETEVSNSPDKEFKIIVIRCLLNLEEWRNIVSTSMKRQQTKKREPIRPEEYNNIHEKYTGGKQQQIRWCRTNQGSGR